ncbi:hypothetical protein C8Q78DRAFT_215340 [Trametes maxima]|nr:hypothetical protein C8Q78DRAFT_215340 [Trametes maxima]
MIIIPPTVRFRHRIVDNNGHGHRAPMLVVALNFGVRPRGIYVNVLKYGHLCPNRPLQLLASRYRTCPHPCHSALWAAFYSFDYLTGPPFPYFGVI